MAFALTLIEQDDSGLALVSAEGEATIAEFPSGSSVHFDNVLGPLWDSRFVALDMDRVAYIDSSAIGWLLSTHKLFRAAGGMLALHSAQPQVRQVIELLKINRVIPIAPDLAAARAALQARMTAVTSV